jgi:serine/threonine protein kinase
MGSVYLAEHPHIGKKVALKVLHAEFASNTDVVTRFFNEAKAVNDIGHPNIVDIVDYGALQLGPGGEGLVYFIMEFLPGLTLTQLIQREAPLAPERALGIALQVADALSASHKCQHRPPRSQARQHHLDPARPRARLRQAARLRHRQAHRRSAGLAPKTRTGLVMGTPAYMSPSSARAAATSITARTSTPSASSSTR